jgi:hypothetical protein
MPSNPLGSNVSRYIDGRDRQYAGVVFEKNKPPLDSELNLATLVEIEQRAEEVRADVPSGWLMNESSPRTDFSTSPLNSNQFFFGRNGPGEVRGSAWAVVNGWVIPVTGTRTGAPPLASNDSDVWNRIALNPPSTSTGGNRAELVFLEVWLARIDVDPGVGVAPGKPQRGYVYRFGNVESGFSYPSDGLVDPDVNYETTKRIQIQYRIRVVPDVNLAQFPEGFDPTLVHAQGALTSPSAVPFENMRSVLGDPGLWRSGTGDPETFGTVDGYVYAIPICSVFRRNGAGFSDVGNHGGAFNRNSVATNRDGATSYSSSPIVLPALLAVADVQFVLTSLTGTVLSTMSSFGEAYFRLDDEIVRVNNVTQVGPTSFIVTLDRGQLNTTIRSHLAGTPLTMYTTRPDGLYADQVASTDILDLRHSVADKFDYQSTLRTGLMELLRGNLRTAWKRYGSTNSSGPVVLYGDRVTDGSVFVGGLTRLDGPNGNRRMFSDAVTVERFEVAVRVPSNSDSVGDDMQVAVAPWTIRARWNAAPALHPAGNRLSGGVQWWWNGDQIRVSLSDFSAGTPVLDADQVRFVLPSEDPDAVIARFEGMTTDPAGGVPSAPPLTVSPTASNPNLATTGLRVLKSGQGLTVTIDGPTGDLLVTLSSGATDTALAEFTDAVPTPASDPLATGTVLHLQFAVLRGAGRGLSHKPDFIHAVHYRGDPANSSRVILRGGLADKSRMVPTALSESPYVQTGRNRQMSRTSEIMVDPGSKTAWVAPYRNVLVHPLLARDGSRLNWYGNNGSGLPTTYQGPMPTLNQAGTATVHSTVDPLSLFYVAGLGRYVEIPFDYLPRPGLHHVPIVPTTNGAFPSGINFLLMSKEGPFAGPDSSDWNRGLVSYPSTAGYYVATPVVGEVYGTSSGSFSAFGRKYSNAALRAAGGGPFRGIQFPPFYGPARITGVYKRDTSGGGPYPVVPTSSPFSTDRVFVGGIGTDSNLLRDDFDGPTFLLDVDVNGDLTFVLNADALDMKRATPGTTFDNSEFLVECTLFGFDRGFLQTNGRVLIARSSTGGSLPVPVNTFTVSSDQKVGIIVPAPMTLNATNNEVTVYYSRQPYQGDPFGSQSAFSDDPYRLGPLTISEANSIRANQLGPVSTLALPNKSGYEVLAAMNFVTTLGTGRLSGSNPLPILSSESNPSLPQDFPGGLTDLSRRFSANRVGFEDWRSSKFPVIDSSFGARPALAVGGLSEVFDRDVHPELAGCVSHLPLGAWFREKDFVGKSLYQIRSSSDVGVAPLGSFITPPYVAPQNPAPPGSQTWEGTEFVCGGSSGTAGVGGEVVMRVDGTSNLGDNVRFKTTRGGAAWSGTSPWPGGAIASRMSRAKPNSEVGSVLAGTAYLVRSQPEVLSSVEVHHGHELQMLIVTQGSPAYFRDTEVLHSANGTNEGFTAADRFRLWGRPLEKRRGGVDLSSIPGDKPLFVNAIYDDPTFFGSSDISTTSYNQSTITIASNGQTVLQLPSRPLTPQSVMVWLNGIKLTAGVNYTVSGPDGRTLTYVPTLANPELTTSDTLEVFYPLL